MLPAMQVTGTDGAVELRYWRTFNELAALNQRDDLLGQGHRKMMLAMERTQDAHCQAMLPGAARNDCLADVRDAEDANFSNLIAYYDRSPIDAGRIAEAAWRKGGSAAKLDLALYYYTRARAYTRVAALLGALDTTQLQAAERSASFLARRAEYWRATGEPGRALADLRRAGSLPDADSETQAALMWALVDLGSDAEVSAMMRRLQGEAESDPGLWGAFAAGSMRFQDGRTALHYLRKLSDARRADPLWLGLAADAYEAIGQADVAWRLRRQAWVELHHAWRAGGGKDSPAVAAGADDEPLNDEAESAEGMPSRGDLQRQTVALGQLFASGDVSRQLVAELLRGDRAAAAGASDAGGAVSALGEVPGLPPLEMAPPPEFARRQQQVSAAAKEAVLAWTLSSESDEQARAWLAKHYAGQLMRPAYAEVTLALSAGDLDGLDRILARQAGRVPVANRIEAEHKLGRLAAAQTLAFETQERARSDDALQDTLQETLLANAQAIEPRVRYLHQAPLAFYEGSLAAGVRLWRGYDLGLAGVWRDQRSVDSRQLTGVPATDRRADVSLGYRDPWQSWRLSVGRRDGLDSMTTARFFGEWRQGSRLTFTTLAGLNQPADESAPLRVGGAKDVLGLGATWRFSLREFVGARVEYSRFVGQDGSQLGHGMVYEAEAGYRIRTAYPDYTVRLVGTHASYSGGDGGLTPLLATLVPAGQAATRSFYLPQGFTQVGMTFGFGTELTEVYTRKWRPFAEVGLLYDTRARHNARAQAGVAGSVFGNDHLSLYVSHETAALNGGKPLTEAGLRYRWLY